MKKATYIVITAAVVLAAALLLTGAAAAAATDEVNPVNDTQAAGHPFPFITQFIGGALTATLNGVADIAEGVNEAAMNSLPAGMGPILMQVHGIFIAAIAAIQFQVEAFT